MRLGKIEYIHFETWKQLTLGNADLKIETGRVGVRTDHGARARTKPRIPRPKKLGAKNTHHVPPRHDRRYALRLHREGLPDPPPVEQSHELLGESRLAERRHGRRRPPPADPDADPRPPGRDLLGRQTGEGAGDGVQVLPDREVLYRTVVDRPELALLVHLGEDLEGVGRGGQGGEGPLGLLHDASVL